MKNQKWNHYVDDHVPLNKWIIEVNKALNDLVIEIIVVICLREASDKAFKVIV